MVKYAINANKVKFRTPDPHPPTLSLQAPKNKKLPPSLTHRCVCVRIVQCNAMEDVGEEGGQQCRPSRSESLIQSDPGQFDTGYYYYNYYYYYDDYY